ncbi:MAG TPA: leucine-rich repeat protein, partial [Negativicutes bacterium]|nr:leucine-rich repeat protein [Negativicutes bacterium]
VVALVMVFGMTAGMLPVSAASSEGDFYFDAVTGTITGYGGAGGAVEIPSTINSTAVTAIGEDAFQGLNNIESIIIPDGVKNIGPWAFSNCGALISVQLPGNLEEIGAGAFYNTGKLKAVNIPGGLEAIPDHAFCGSGLESITIPGNIKSIGKAAFYNNPLEWLDLSEGILTIGTSAFKACNQLKGVKIPKSVTKIENEAFAGEGFSSPLTKLAAVVFKGAAPNLGTDVFKRVSKDFTIYYPAAEEAGYKDKDSWSSYSIASYDPSESRKLIYDTNEGDSGSVPAEVSGLAAGTYVIVEESLDLGRSGYRFSHWNSKRDNTGEYYNKDDIAFVGGADTILYACWDKLFKISLSDAQHGSITTDVTEAVQYHSVEVTVTPDEGYRLKPGTLKYFDGTYEYPIDGSMAGAPALSSSSKVIQPPYEEYDFMMPDADITISAEFESDASDYSFDETSGTITKYYGEGGNIFIPSKINGVQVKYIGENAFTGSSNEVANVAPIKLDTPDDTLNTTLTGVVIPEGVIGIDYKAFSGCTALQGVTLPETLEYIDTSAFNHCSSLKSIRIPANVQTVEYHAFYNCGSLISACFDGSAPATSLEDEIFDNAAAAFRILYHSGNTGFDNAPLSDYPSFEIESADPATAIAADLDKLELIYAFNDTRYSVLNNLYLTVTGAVYGSDISWETIDAEVITVDGSVTRPSFSKGDAKVILTAKASCNSTEASRQFEVKVPKAEQAQFTVIFNSNGGNTEATPASMTVMEGEAPGTLPTAPTRNGYNFTGWNTAANGSGATFTGATAVMANITVYAQWTKITSNNNKNGHSNNNSGTSTASTASTPATGGAAIITASSSNGKATATVTGSQLAAGGNIGGLTISSPIAEISFDGKSLGTLSKEATEDIKVTIAKIEASTLSEEARQAIGDRPVYDFSVKSGDKTISRFDGSVTVSVPYTPKEGEDLNAIVIYYINAEGKPEVVSNCAYDSQTGKITFTTNHFSIYAIGYNKQSFTDVPEDAWYSKAVAFTAARNITAGTGNGRFEPEGSLSRGQFLVMVMRAYGIAPEENAKDNFIDAGNTYYTDYLAAAKRLGLAKGVGGSRYAPDKAVTRQEMFTLLYKTLKVMGKLDKVPSTSTTAAFSDAVSIAPWAGEAVTRLSSAGITGGISGKLSPEAPASRAQMAQMLYQLLNK